MAATQTQQVRVSGQASLEEFKGVLLAQKVSLEQKLRGDLAQKLLGAEEDVKFRIAALHDAEKDGCEDLLHAVETSLRKYEDGTYGVCPDCHKPIDLERLRAMPAATKCLDCEEKEQNRRRRQNHFPTTRRVISRRVI